MKLRLIILSLILAGWFGTIGAKTIAWSVRPTYQEVKYLAPGIYLYKENNKWGFLDSSGNISHSAVYDEITPFYPESPALLLIYEGGKKRIAGFMYPDGRITNLSQRYYATPYTVFSEGKLCASDGKKQGHIDAKGNVVIPFKYDGVLPFGQGLAGVFMSGEPVFYITVQNEMRRIPLNKGDNTRMTTFRNGEAAVGNGEFEAIINLNRETVRKISHSSIRPENTLFYTISSTGDPKPIINTEVYDTKVTEYQSGGKYGFREGNRTVFPATFDYATGFNKDGYAIVTQNGKKGFVKLIDGDFKGTFATNSTPGNYICDDDRDPMCTYTISVPSGIDKRDLSVKVDKGDGKFTSIDAANLTNGIYHFKPLFATNARQFTTAIEIYYLGNKVYESSDKANIEYPVRITVSAPQKVGRVDVVSTQQRISASVHNSGSRTVTVTATLTVDGRSKTESLTIGPNSSSTISTSVYAEPERNVTATISVAGGPSASSTLHIYDNSY